jgi:hypothetical protein
MYFSAQEICRHIYVFVTCSPSISDDASLYTARAPYLVRQLPVSSGIIKYHFLERHVLVSLIAQENLDGAIEAITSSSSFLNDAIYIYILN